MLSGFAASLVQKSQQAVGAVHPLFYSAELAVYSITCLLMGLVFQVVTGKGDGQAIATLGLWQGYDLTTFIPIFTNSIGGLLVGTIPFKLKFLCDIISDDLSLFRVRDRP